MYIASEYLDDVTWARREAAAQGISFSAFLCRALRRIRTGREEPARPGSNAPQESQQRDSDEAPASAPPSPPQRAPRAFHFEPVPNPLKSYHQALLKELQLARKQVEAMEKQRAWEKKAAAILDLKARALAHFHPALLRGSKMIGWLKISAEHFEVLFYKERDRSHRRATAEEEGEGDEGGV